eukprot:GHRQ01037675.1.p1 GENE.GHRQ01037675.1~~GHRQ01037675.1.p1  ORF type:complete len:210 (+),score=86.52 GHRQ01037675.1:602-1231(+)
MLWHVAAAAVPSQACQLDPAAEISDGMHKSAEQVVRKVISEVHGPFFNTEILDKELTHLEKAACHLDPVTQPAEAATLKLLASALVQLDCDEAVDDDYDSLAPHAGIDPFSVPSFAPVMRVVEQAAPTTQQLAGMKQLTIQLAGAAMPAAQLFACSRLVESLHTRQAAAWWPDLGEPRCHSSSTAWLNTKAGKLSVWVLSAAGTHMRVC